jgi:trans-aconitate methyltransferase
MPFDKRYYDRFYRARRRHWEQEAALLGDFVCSYLRYMRQPVRSVLDIGCGFGSWRKVVARHFPRARYHGVEASQYLCDHYGWSFGSVVDYKSRTPFDLVICKDVLQYLTSREANAALDNLARLCRGALYLAALTKEDWEENADRKRTDGDVYMRNANWYRSRLREHFVNLGGGVFLRRDAPVVAWELELLR